MDLAALCSQSTLSCKVPLPLVSPVGSGCSQLLHFQPLGVSLFSRELGWNFHLQLSFLALSEPRFPLQQWVLSQGCLELGGGEQEHPLACHSWCLSLCKPRLVRGSLLADSQLMSVFFICCGWGIPSPAGINPLLLLDVSFHCQIQLWLFPGRPGWCWCPGGQGASGQGTFFGSPAHH